MHLLPALTAFFGGLINDSILCSTRNLVSYEQFNLPSQFQFIDQFNQDSTIKMDIQHPHPQHQHSATSTHRTNRIKSIKNSLKDFALISKNKNMVQKKLSLQCQTLSQNGSSDGLSFECEDSSMYSPYQHAEIFGQKYEMISKLGQGSDGVVHRCKKKRSGQDYAVKSFMFDDEHIPQIRSNFVLVKGLTHRNIIKYQALYLDLKKHACWLVMELCQAPSLARLQISSENQLRQIIQQLLQTLHYLHQRAVSHRDIKAQNILYDPVNKKLKLIDYGICRKHRRRGTKFQMLTITGTLYYRAPEMFTGGGYTEKVDVWSTGVMIYKLITGHTPFESQYHSKTIENIMSAQLSFTPQFDRYSASLKHLVSKMLRKDPRERPSALDCLRQPWFYTSNSSISHNFLFSEEANEQDLQCLKSPMIEGLEEGSYIRKINGDQYHCFDSDDEGMRKGVGVKRVHRSVTLELGFHSLTNFQL